MNLAASGSGIFRASPTARYVFLTFVVGYLLYLVPVTGPIRWLRPDFPLLVLLYWCINQPKSGGYLVGFSLGLMTDIADGNVLGQHALAYAVAVYLTLSWRVRILKFGVWQQALHVLPILLASQVAVAFTHLFMPATFPGWAYFLGGFAGALVWPLIAFAIEYPRLRKASFGAE
jgi:rod shape-determining protein MreD